MITSSLFRETPEKKRIQNVRQQEMIDSLDCIKQSVSDFAFIMPDLTTYLKEKF